MNAIPEYAPRKRVTKMVHAVKCKMLPLVLSIPTYISK